MGVFFIWQWRRFEPAEKQVHSQPQRRTRRDQQQEQLSREAARANPAPATQICYLYVADLKASFRRGFLRLAMDASTTIYHAVPT